MPTIAAQLRPIALGLTALIAWELAGRRAEQRRLAGGADYWRTYYDSATLQRADALRQTHTIQSTGVAIHLDVYPQPNAGAPVVIFNHGGAGYCRLFVAPALGFHERGYTVVLPDQRGQGYSGGPRGDYTIAECTQNIVDTAHWARERFGAPIFIAGGSVGGALTYYAAAAGAPAKALACLNLFDFGAADALRFSRLAPLSALPSGMQLVRTTLKLLRTLHWVRLPGNWLARFDRLMDDRDAPFQQQWDADPIPPRRLSLRQVLSNLTTPPAVPFEQNRVPTLVLNQARDRMVDPAITQANYHRLGGLKHYAELDYGHWSSDPAFFSAVIQASDAWFRANS